MDYFPAFLKLEGRPCLLVGGGAVALRKARLLVSAGANVTAVAPRFNAAFESFAATAQIRLHRRAFEHTDVAGHWLVVSATGRPGIERAVFDAASASNVFCNSVDDLEGCSYITPAIVDRSPVVVAISSGGAAPVLARKLRERIERVLPSRLADLAKLARGWRARATRRFESLAGRRRFWEAVFDGPVASRALAGDSAGAERLLHEFMASTEAPMRGEAWLVGAGPGDPDLLTLKALRTMQSADVILHDRLVSKEILAMVRRDADLIPVGKKPGYRANSQEEINALLVSLVASGKRVCRLKGGDPFVFGRGGEEAQALADAGLPFEIVPGITAAAGCAANAAIPLTHRDLSQSVAFVTAHGKDSVDKLDWASLARDRQTLAFYMAVSRFSELMHRLIAHGRAPETPVAIVENGTRPEQRVIRGTLGQLSLLAEAHRISPPAILLVGEVAALGIDSPVPQASSIYAKQSYRDRKTRLIR